MADQGPGIPGADRGARAERFFRGESARNTPGSGLGLALVQAVAQLHGGSLRLADAAPGLVAVLSLPAHEEPAPRSANAIVMSAPRRGEAAGASHGAAWDPFARTAGLGAVAVLARRHAGGRPVAAAAGDQRHAAILPASAGPGERDGPHRGAPPPQEVTFLSSEGQRMCDQGQTRGGILRLRRALVLMMHRSDDGP